MPNDDDIDLPTQAGIAIRACGDLLLLFLREQQADVRASIAELAVRGCHLVVEIEPLGAPINAKPRIEFVLIDADGERHAVGRVGFVAAAADCQ